MKRLAGRSPQKRGMMMLPLFDMMLQAQNGRAMEEWARQFGLAQEQATKAIAALMPAFSTGLKRTAANPYDFTKFMGHLASGNYTAYFEDMGRAFTPEGVAEGNRILGQIFGSKDVSRAIAEQAERMTGIGQDVYKKMMPSLATAMMGGLMKQGMGQMPGQEFWTDSPQARLIEQWMQAAGFTPKPKVPDNPLFDNPFAQSMQSFFGQKPAGGDAANPFTGMMEAMMDMMGQGSAPATTPPAGDKAQTASPAGPLTDMMNQMFDSGLEVQKSYQKNMDAIFETYLGAFGKTDGKDG